MVLQGTFYLGKKHEGFCSDVRMADDMRYFREDQF